MKKLLALIALYTLLSPVFATNPWSGDGDTVQINVQVSEITEFWSAVGRGQARNPMQPPVTLVIQNAGGKLVPSGARYSDTVYTKSNVDVQVSVSLDGDLPNWTRLHVIVNPINRATYNQVNTGLNYSGAENVQADNIVTWSRLDGIYQANVPGDVIEAFTAASTMNNVPRSMKIDYVADAINGMPELFSDKLVHVVYTIAPAS